MATTDVKVQITADGSQVPREADKVKKSIAGIGKAGDTLSSSFAKIGGTIAGALSVGAFTAFLSKVNQAADQLNDLSGRLGASAANLQVLQVAAQQAGGSAEAMNTALAKLSTTIGDALAGSKQATEAFGRLGLNARELATLKTDEAMRRVSDALAGIDNTYERASIAQDIFGKGAKELAGFFAEAPSAISETEAALRDAGAALSDIDVAKIGVMNDELALQGTIVQNLGTKFLANLSPAISVAVDSFADLIANLGGATKAGETFGVVMVAAIKMVEAGVYSLAAVFETLRAGVAVILQGITAGVSGLIDILASAADAAGLDIAGRLQAAANVAGEFSQSLGNVATTAWANAKAAGAAALQAAADVLNAEAIFDQYSAKLEARAAAIQASAAAAQGAAVGAGGAGGATDAAGRARGRQPIGSADPDALAREFDRFDPLRDPKVRQQYEINAALAAIDDEYRQTTLGKIEAFNETTLGMMLNFGQRQIDFEQNKAGVIGGLTSDLVNTAIQSGGKLGKFGKALAIAQTVWSTGQAAMKAYAELGPIAGSAAAALILATGAAQLANIKKTNIGSGGSIVGARGGGGALPSPSISDNVAGVQPQQEARSVGQIIFNGPIMSGQETARWLIDTLADAMERDVVFISSNSRQAMELAGA